MGGNSTDDDLVSGFLTAISNFAKEIKGGEIKALNFRNFNFIYAYNDEVDTMFIIVIDIDDPLEEAQEKVNLMKDEFIKRYKTHLGNWSGEVTIFQDFNAYVEENIFIPPKILLVGEDGVGKSTIMDLFPGETLLQLDEDLNEIIEKPINVSGLEGIKQFILREIDLEDLIDNSKVYRPLLDAADIILIVTNSGASNLGRTKKLFGYLKPKVKKAEFHIIANFQDRKETSFEPSKIEEAFNLKTHPFSAIKKNAKEDMFKLMVKILDESILQKLKKNQEEAT